MSDGNHQGGHSARAPSTSRSLLLRLRDGGDAAAWETFIGVYSAVVYGFCRRRGLQDSDARDVTQDVFTNLSRAMRTFEYDPAKGKFRSWLGLLTRRGIGHHLRNDKSSRGLPADAERVPDEHVLGEEDPHWIDEFQQHVLQAALTRIRGQFSDEVWRAFEITWLESQPPQAAAVELGKTRPWVYKAKFKVLERLHEEIEFLTADIPFLHR